MRISLSLFSTPKKQYLNNGGTLSRNSQEVNATIVLLWWRSKESAVPSLSPPSNHDHLSQRSTWVMTTPGTPLTPVPLSLDQLPTPALHPSSFVLCPRLNSELPGEQKRSWGSYEKKKKIDQGPGKLHKKKMPLNVSYATISIPLTHFFWRRHSSAHRSGYSCLETIAGVLLRQLLSYCEADAFFSRQSI